jgi:hypothetical protein
MNPMRQARRVTRHAAVSAVSRRTLLSGRLFTAADDAAAPPVAMVNCRWRGTFSRTPIR